MNPAWGDHCGRLSWCRGRNPGLDSISGLHLKGIGRHLMGKPYGPTKKTRTGRADLKKA